MKQQIVIEIDAMDLERIKARTGKSSSDFIILHGKPLPKGHGDLKDVNMFKASVIRAEHNADGTSALFDATDICRMLDSVPAIIAADKAEGENKE